MLSLFTKQALRIGHRGASKFFPENTLLGFNQAFSEYRADAVELDLQITRDGHPVVIHDRTLDRTTNGRGKVSSKSLQEIKQLDASYHFDPEQKGSFPFRSQNISIPTLEEVLKNFQTQYLMLEIKGTSKELTHKTVELIKHFKAESRVLMGSLDNRPVRILKKTYPKLHRFYSKTEIIGLYTQFKLFPRQKSVYLPENLVASLPLKSWGFNLTHQAWIAYLRQRKINIIYWTVNEAATIKELLQKGANGIVTDDLTLSQPSL